jgi:hypothetical protein
MLGRKGIEPLTALAIEFTAQPIIPANGTFLFYYIIQHIIIKKPSLKQIILLVQKKQIII